MREPILGNSSRALKLARDGAAEISRTLGRDAGTAA
jgi:hypothetical protein